MVKKVAKYRNDPLANVRIDRPRTADEARADAHQNLVDAAADEAAAEADIEEAPSVAEIADTSARVRAEKREVTAPAKIVAGRLPRYMVVNDQTVSWRGQQLRLKGGKSIVSDERHGPGAVKQFKAMGIQMKEAK